VIKKDPTDPFTSSAADGSRAIALTNGQQLDFGSGSFDYLYGDGTFIVTPGSIVASNFYSAVGSGVNVVSRDGDDANAHGIIVNTTSALTTSGGKLASFQNNSVEKAYVDKDGHVSGTSFGLGGLGASKGMDSSGANLRINAVTGFSMVFQDASGNPFFNATAGGISLTTTSVIGTAGSGIGITTNNSAQVVSFCHKITIAETALTAAATTQDITLWTVPAKTQITRVIAETTTGFTGGTIAAMVVTVGKSAGGVEYLASGSVFAAGVLGDVVAEMGAGLKSATLDDFPNFSGAGTISCRFTATGDNVVNATAGSVTFYILGNVLP
jgi:hypothetical protein